MFQFNASSFRLPMPYNGISSISQNDPTYAKYIQNILVDENKTLSLRHGTQLFREFSINGIAEKNISNIIYTVPLLLSNGMQRIISYINRFVPVVNNKNNIKAVINNNVLTITLSNINQYKKYLQHILNYNRIQINIDDDYLVDEFIVQYDERNNIITITIQNWFIDNININNINVEIGAICIGNANNMNYTILVDDLNANVFPNSIFLDNKLLLYNGIDINVWIGQDGLPYIHKYPISFPNLDEIKKTGTNITFKVLEVARNDIQNNIDNNIKYGINDKYIAIINDIEYNFTTTNTTLGSKETFDNLDVFTITLTVDNDFPQLKAGDNLSKILYFKVAPPITLASVVHKRLFYVSSGRINKYWSNNPIEAMKVYFADRISSIDRLVNEKKRYIDFISLSANLEYPDELIRIEQLNNDTIFFCRKTIIVYTGTNPTSSGDTDGNDDLQDFKPKKIIKSTGIKHYNFIQVFPSFILFLSDSFELYQLSIINQTLQLEATKLAGHINAQLKKEYEYIKNDYEYRLISSFFYPYNRLFGIKIKTNTFVLNIASNSWTIFTGNFNNAKSFCYSTVDNNLYLGMPNGKLLRYTDKTYNIQYTEYNIGAIQWSIYTGWIEFDNTWANYKLYLACKTLEHTNINIKLLKDFNETKTKADKNLFISQIGSIYDLSFFDNNYYSNSKGNYPNVRFKFLADSIYLKISGESSNPLVLYNFEFSGGVHTGTGVDNAIT